MSGVSGADNGNNIIRLKGTDQSIDLNQLKNLRETVKNRPLFQEYDTDHDGKLNDAESAALGKAIREAAGNSKLSQREMKKAFGEDFFDNLQALTNQQDAFKAGKDYTESSFNNGIKESQTTYKKDGSTSTEWLTGQNAGKKEEVTADGVRTLIHAQNDKEVFYQDGRHERTYGTDPVVTDKFDSNDRPTQTLIDGKVRQQHIYTDNQEFIQYMDENEFNYKTEEKDGDGNVTATIEHEKDSDNNVVSRRYQGDGSDKSKLESITVDSQTTSVKYDSEEAYSKGHPSEKIEHRGLPTETKTVYTQNEDGTITATTTNKAGETTTQKLDSDYKPIADKPEVHNQHVVKKNETVQGVVVAALKEQGIENPTDAQIKQATEQLFELNPINQRVDGGVVRIAQNDRFNGQAYLIAGATLDIPEFKLDSKATMVIDGEAAAEAEEASEEEAALEVAARLVDGGSAEVKEPVEEASEEEAALEVAARLVGDESAEGEQPITGPSVTPWDPASLAELGIPDDVISYGPPAIVQYANEHNIQLP